MADGQASGLDTNISIIIGAFMISEKERILNLLSDLEAERMARKRMMILYSNLVKCYIATEDRQEDFMMRVHCLFNDMMEENKKELMKSLKFDIRDEVIACYRELLSKVDALFWKSPTLPMKTFRAIEKATEDKILELTIKGENK
jgi:hypothetical protein